MKFRSNKSAVARELNLLQGVVEKKNTIPILSHILIEASDGGEISMIATDLDVSVTTTCEAQIDQAGSMVVSARKLFDIVRNLPESEIDFVTQENNWVRVSCGSSDFKIAGQAREHFPSTPKAGAKGLAFPSSLLNKLISRTIYAITQEESRYALNGSLMISSEDRLQMVATDGHRLAISAGESVEGGSKEQARVIIPRKALTELMRLTAGEDSPVEFSKDENHLFFSVGKRQLTSRMLAGQFPNYELVLPKNNDKSFTTSTDGITQAIRRASLMADERSHGVKFELATGRLSITSQTADVGEAKEVIPVDYEGDVLNIGFNAAYLLDFLTVAGSEQTIFEFKDDQSPALLRPQGESGEDYRYVVMPMRLM
ncbi:MAG TPA: DNA polymerase III subunit beta [Blastocatellia bacterium]|nr:DNA polymerase III subunit beta [Blastocatellia bacterium]